MQIKSEAIINVYNPLQATWEEQEVQGINEVQRVQVFIPLSQMDVSSFEDYK